MNKKKILLVDDEEFIIELLQINLEDTFEIISCDNGESAVKLANTEIPDIILLDIMLPKLDGYQVCKLIRENNDTKNIPIIMLTAKKEENDKVKGFELGADDYIVKPFGIKEILARINAIFRRTEKNIANQTLDSNLNNVIKINNLVIDNEKYQVTKDGNIVDLSLREFKLLQTLLENRGCTVSREALMEQVWGNAILEDSRTLDVHIRKLRKKIENNPKYPELIETIRGIGYMFK